MTRLTVSYRSSAPEGATIVRGVHTDQLDGFAPADRELLRLSGFKAKVGDVHTVLADGVVAVLVGLGERGRLDLPSLRHAVAAAVRC